MRELEDRLRRVSPATVRRIHDGLGRVHRGVGAVLFSAFFAVGAWMAWHDLQPMLSWRPTDAIVMQSDVQRVPTTRQPALWRPRVQYRWEYAGRWYTGDRLARTEMSFRQRARAWKIANRYTGLQHVRAWVDPKAPTEAVLDRTPSFFPYLFLLVVGVLAWFFAFIGNPRERRWRASGPGWKLDVHMPGVPADPGADTSPGVEAIEPAPLRDGTTGEAVSSPVVENRPIE